MKFNSVINMNARDNYIGMFSIKYAKVGYSCTAVILNVENIFLCSMFL